MSPAAAKPRWRVVADELRRQLKGPTGHQLETARRLQITLPRRTPAPVARVILHWHVTDPSLRDESTVEVSITLLELEEKLELPLTRTLLTNSREELSAWIFSRYMLQTELGLRELKPVPGDVVHQQFRPEGDNRVVSSIGEDGRVHFAGRYSGRAWPNHLSAIARVGSAGHAAAKAAAENRRINNQTSTTTNLDSFAPLEQYKLESSMPSAEAVRVLEDLLESGEGSEESFQRVITAHPALLGALVIGNWATYVIPKPRLGAEYVPDYLVLGINSNGPNWILVEIERPTHNISLQSGQHSGETRHAISQIVDWREWLIDNVSYAQRQGFVGLTTNSHGLVIIGRDTPSPVRQGSRVNTEWESRIAVHSWDWLLRTAQTFSADPFRVSRVATDVQRHLDEDRFGTEAARLPETLDSSPSSSAGLAAMRPEDVDAFFSLLNEEEDEGENEGEDDRGGDDRPDGPEAGAR